MKRFRKKGKRFLDGSALNRYRKENDLSLQELADKVGVSPSCVWGWETGKTGPRKHNFERLMRVLSGSGDMS